MHTRAMNESNMGVRLEGFGKFMLRYSLVLVVAWIGAMKFTAYEAAGIQPLVAGSPFLSWMYKVMSVQTASHVIGVTELAIALMIALRPVSWKLAAVGSLLAIGMFLTTVSFLFTLPGWEQSLGGFPALSGSGGFLLKDLILLSVAVWSLGEALQQGQN